MFRSFATYCNKLLAKDLHVQATTRIFRTHPAPYFTFNILFILLIDLKLSTAIFSNVPFSIPTTWCELYIYIYIYIYPHTHTHTHILYEPRFHYSSFDADWTTDMANEEHWFDSQQTQVIHSSSEFLDCL